jgi:S-adenosyl-L-methionine hydrolase (adenosine-forming)
MNTIISFLSDFGLADTSFGQCKGVIAAISPKAVVIDITHSIPPYDVTTGAWVLQQAAPYFPPCNHVAVVDPGVGTARRGIAVECARGDVLIGPDNGLLLKASEGLGGIVSVVELADPQFRRLPLSPTFHGRDIFCPAAAHLMHGVSLHLLGPRIDPAGLVRLPERQARVVNGAIETAVATINEFGSLALTASAALLQEIGSPTHIAFSISDKTLSARVVRTFGEAPIGTTVAFTDSYGYITLAINQDSLAAMVGITRRDHPEVTLRSAPYSELQ